MSIPRSLRLPDLVRPGSIQTARGTFAALTAQPATGFCERQPALLIPGYTGSKEDFLPVLEPLAMAGRRVVAIDMRGQYQSQGAADHGGYSADELAADVAAVAAKIAEDDAGTHLLGHSFGGLIARQTVLATSAGIASLTLLGSGPASVGGQRAAILRQLLAQLDPHDGRAGHDVGLLRKQVMRLWDEHLGPQAEADGTPRHIVSFLRERTLRNCPIGLIAMGRYLLGCPDLTRELADRSDMPILVVYGENDDAWLPEVQDLMARRLRAERVCIPAAAHSPAVEAPETTASTLTSFWNLAERSERRRQAAGHQAGSRAGHSGRAGTAAGRPAEPASKPALELESAWSGEASPSHGRRGTAADPPSGQCAR